VTSVGGAARPAAYRTQRRGGGLRDIKTTERNGPVIGIVSVRDDDELLMMTSRGKIQRVVAGEIRVIGRNTQGADRASTKETRWRRSSASPRRTAGRRSRWPCGAGSPRRLAIRTMNDER
jgi:DNA gyrase/topoisomerase IV subunit A